MMMLTRLVTVMLFNICDAVRFASNTPRSLIYGVNVDAVQKVEQQSPNEEPYIFDAKEVLSSSNTSNVTSVMQRVNGTSDDAWRLYATR